MRSAPKITSLDALRDWFFSNKAPYYTLYAGRMKKSSEVIRRQTESNDINDAWEDLVSILSGFDSGVFTVWTKMVDNNQNTSGFTVHFEMPSAGAVASINGAPQGSNIGIFGNPQYESYIEREVERRVNLATLEQKIKNLENAEVANMSIKDRLVEGIIGDPNNMQMVTALLGNIAGRVLGGAPQPTHVQMAGRTPAYTTTDTSATEDIDTGTTENTSTQEHQEGEDHDYDDDKILDLLDRTKVHIPDPVAVLEKIVLKLEQNPAGTIAMLNLIK
jgi:hypothetical protein